MAGMLNNCAVLYRDTGKADEAVEHVEQVGPSIDWIGSGTATLMHLICRSIDLTGWSGNSDSNAFDWSNDLFGLGEQRLDAFDR